MKKQLDTYEAVRASLVGFNGTGTGKGCSDGRELVHAWRDRQASLSRYAALKLSKENWQDFYHLAHKLVASRCQVTDRVPKRTRAQIARESIDNPNQ